MTLSKGQNLTERIELEDGRYQINTLNENLEVIRKEFYEEDNLVSYEIYNSENGKLAEVFDGLNTFVYNDQGFPSCKNLIWPVSRYSEGWDDMVIEGLSLINGLLSGTGIIYGVRYEKSYSYDPVATYAVSRALGRKIHQYAVATNRSVIVKKDSLGFFSFVNGLYNGKGETNIDNNHYQFEYDNGVLIHFAHYVNDELYNEISSDNTIYKFEGKLYKQPNLNGDFIEQLTYDIEAYGKLTSQTERIAFTPLVLADPFNADFRFKNIPIRRSSAKYNGYGTIVQTYYRKNGSYFAIIPLNIDNTQTESDEGDQKKLKYKPQYVFSFNPLPKVFEGFGYYQMAYQQTLDLLENKRLYYDEDINYRFGVRDVALSKKKLYWLETQNPSYIGLELEELQWKGACSDHELIDMLLMAISKYGINYQGLMLYKGENEIYSSVKLAFEEMRLSDDQKKKLADGIRFNNFGLTYSYSYINKLSPYALEVFGVDKEQTLDSKIKLFPQLIAVYQVKENDTFEYIDTNLMYQSIQYYIDIFDKLYEMFN